jgi:hypothetical protein
MAGLDPSPPGRPKARYNGSAPASEDRARRRARSPRSWTVSGRLPYRPRRATRFLDRFGFSWTVMVLPRKAPKTRLGLPWISLDSLVRIETFQWVTRDYPRRKFLAPFAARQRAGQEGYSYDAEMQYGSSSKSNSFSAFMQSIGGDRNVESFSSRGRGASDFTHPQVDRKSLISVSSKASP